MSGDNKPDKAQAIESLLNWSKAHVSFNEACERAGLTAEALSYMTIEEQFQAANTLAAKELEALSKAQVVVYQALQEACGLEPGFVNSHIGRAMLLNGPIEEAPEKAEAIIDALIAIKQSLS